MSDAVKITGLREFRAALKNLGSELPKAVRVAFNDAADVIVSDARPRVPRRSGRAAASVKARSTQTSARVVGGGNKVPWFPWLDFGGRVGRRKSVRRPVLPKGRYIYNAFFRRRGEFADRAQDALVDVARRAGLGVD